MSNTAVRDAKEIYIETGRLNRNIISKEVSISWYKCKLQNLKPKDPMKCTGEKPTIGFESKFLSYVDTVVPQYFDYILVNMSLQRCSSRMLLSNFTEMDTIDDLSIGTNGGYLTYKTQTNQLVSQDEHYLECFSDYYSYGIMVSQGEKMLGVLMLLSNEKPNEYDIVKIREKLIQFNAKSDVMSSEMMISSANTRDIKQLFAYTPPYMIEFEQLVEKIGNNALPILIRGSEGSGKSTLARFLADKRGVMPFIISLNETPRSLQKNYIESGLSQFDTVIIEALEYADPETLRLLTAYTEDNIVGKNREKHSNYKCSSLILTTVYRTNKPTELLLSRLQEKQLIKFTDKLKLNTVNLVNTNTFIDDIEALVEAIIEKNGIMTTDSYKVKLIEYTRENSFKKVQQMIDVSMDHSKAEDSSVLTDFPVSIAETLLNLEDFEREYILKIYDLMDKNMTATANILNIGRSTLYRKLEKYQNDTTEK